MLTPEQKAKWVAALRSGKYKQGFEGFLRTKQDEYCCLGVLYEVCEFGKWSNSTSEYPSRAWAIDSGRDGWLDEDLLSRDTQVVYASLNDQAKKSFSEIADYIEQNL